jgi:hypothetical protein
MYEPDRRFFNEDGSVNIELATAAGREARSQALFEGFSLAGDTVVCLFRSVRRAIASLYSRTVSSRMFQNETT